MVVVDGDINVNGIGVLGNDNNQIENNGNSIIAHDFGFTTEFDEISRQVENETVVVVDQQDHGMNFTEYQRRDFNIPYALWSVS